MDALSDDMRLDRHSLLFTNLYKDGSRGEGIFKDLLDRFVAECASAARVVEDIESGREQVDQGTRAVVEANVARTRLYKSLLAEAESHYSAVQSFKNLSTKAREQAEDHVKSAEKKAAKIMALFVI